MLAQCLLIAGAGVCMHGGLPIGCSRCFFPLAHLGLLTHLMAASLRISAPTYMECANLLAISQGKARLAGVARRAKATASGKFCAHLLTQGGKPPNSKMSAPIRSLFNPAAKVTIP